MEFLRECSTQYITQLTSKIELNTRREIPYLQATFIIYHVQHIHVYAIYQAQTFAIHHVLLFWDVTYISR